MNEKKGRRCSRCRAWIPPEEVQLPHEETERCHDCGDYCDDPDCVKCAAGNDTNKE